MTTGFYNLDLEVGIKHSSYQFYLVDLAFNKEDSFADIYMQIASFQVPSILDYDHKTCHEETVTYVCWFRVKFGRKFLNGVFFRK